MQRFLQGYHDVCFDVAPAFRHGAALPKSPEGRPTTTSSEECLEKIAEPGPAELKFDTTVFPTAPVKSTAALPATPLRRRLKPAGLIPILAQLIVFPPLFQIVSVPELGKFLVGLGAVIVVLGLLLWSGVGSGWLGRLPGDIRIERGNSTFYFPIVTCIIISIVLSLIFSLFRR